MDGYIPTTGGYGAICDGGVVSSGIDREDGCGGGT